MWDLAVQQPLITTKVNNMQNSLFENSQPTLEQCSVIRWLGDCIFPQPIIASAEKFGEDAIIACINAGLIFQSQSKIGSDPTLMRKPKGYMELTDAGWELYKKLTGEAIV